MSVMVFWYGDKAKAAAKSGSNAGLKEAATKILAESQKLVPVETGALKDSGHINATGDLVATISYSAIPYDIIQHEALEFNHPNGGQAKYLENPFNAYRNEALAIEAKAIKSKLGA